MPDAEVIRHAGPPWVYFFGPGRVEGDAERKDILGGKGAGLAAMSRAGLPVPPGFTISVEACRRFHENAGQWPDGLEQEARDHMARLETATGRRFGEGRLPLLVSVRSGAAVSMPGMMDTILNCGLHTGLAAQVPDPRRFWVAYVQFIRQFIRVVENVEEHELDPCKAPAEEQTALNLLRYYSAKTGKAFPDSPWSALRACVDAVFRSWNNERALVYRQAHDIKGLFGTAVNVQSMFPSEISGIIFTANPTNAAAEIVIESAYGLGESIVSGDVTPDRFIVDRATRDIRQRVIGHKGRVMIGLAEDSAPCSSDPDAASLTDAQVLALTNLALKVEEFFGFHVDVEWGMYRGEIALLQARPIKGLEVSREVQVGRQEEMARLRALCGGRRKVWVAHNLAETLPAPTPLTWDIIRRFMRGDGGFGGMYRDFGYQPSRVVCDNGFLEMICGRIYVDPECAAQLFWGSMPLAYDLQEVCANPAVLEAAPSRFDPAKADNRFLLKLPAALWAMLRSARRQRRIRENIGADFKSRALPAYLEDLERYRGQDLLSMPTSSLIETFHERMVRVLTEFGKESLKPGFFGGLACAEMERLLVQVLGSRAGKEVCLTLISGLEGDSTVEQDACLHQVAQGKIPMTEFLERYGHRSVSEMELARPRWIEAPDFLEKTVERYKAKGVADPAGAHRANAGRRMKAESELSPLLAQWGGGFLERDIRKLLAEAQALLPYREIGKHYLMMGYAAIRKVLVELDRRWGLNGDVFFLEISELERFEQDRDRLLPAIGRRKLRWKAFQQLACPTVVDSNDLESLGLPKPLPASARMDAVCLAPGVVEGIAKIVRQPDEAGQLPEQCILVCPSTDPGWTALFAVIKGLVVERGGVLSHGAITARDFGIPAVACPEATRRIRDGARIRVDGTGGCVALLEGGLS